jgi:hypothetical protein
MYSTHPRPNTAHPTSSLQHLNSTNKHLLNASVCHLPPRPSFQGPVYSDIPSFSSRLRSSTQIQAKDESTRQTKHENRLKRTLETMTTGVEKIMGKMGLTRPMRVLSNPPVKSTSIGTKRSSSQTTTESNSIRRPYRSKSKRTKTKHSASQLSTAAAKAHLPTDTPLEQDNMDEKPSPIVPQVVPGNPLSPRGLAFPATAGAGAKAAVAQHKRSFLNLNMLAGNKNQRDSVTAVDMEIDQPDGDNSDLEIISTQSLTDSMDLDSAEPSAVPGTVCDFVIMTILIASRSCPTSPD